MRFAWNEAPEHLLELHGRDLEIWRPALAVAVLLERDDVHDAIAAVQTMVRVSKLEQEELQVGIELETLVLTALKGLAEREIDELHDQCDRPDACPTGYHGLLRAPTPRTI